MKVTCDPRKITVSQTNLGKALGLTTGRVAQLIKEGIVFRDDNDKSGGVFLVRSVQAYTSFKGKSESDDELDYMAEKAKHEKVKRECRSFVLPRKKAGLMMLPPWSWS